MKSIALNHKSVEIKGRQVLKNINLTISPGETWVFLGSNGSGKTSLGALIQQESSDKCGFVSFEREKWVLDRERKEDMSDILNYPDPGRSASRFILEKKNNPELMNELAEQFRFSSLLDRGLKYLSTGELRKVLIAEELMDEPEVLILDEPFDGLDVHSREDLNHLISHLVERGVCLILLLNRVSEIPEKASHVGYLNQGEMLLSGSQNEMLADGQLDRLLHLHYNAPEQLPSPPLKDNSLYSGEILIDMNNIHVAYGDNTVLHDFSWQVQRGVHWKIVGPNGVGKSTLLSLITGDNPQAYANDMTLFGFKKGSGEAVWDIKKHIGYVSSTLQRDYRVRVSVLMVIISGFYDSIGVYGKYSESEERIARSWLKLIKMEDKAGSPFKSLSYGEQRLLLIIRAMVKHPPLLILDEPCQGLDEVNRQMILKLVDIIGETSDTTILYVTHHNEDDIRSVKRLLEMTFHGK